MSFALQNAELSPWVYVHFPLCQHRCSYCDFNVVSLAKAPTNFEATWVRALKCHIKPLKNLAKIPLSGLYFGGGTPSLLSLTALSEVIKILDEIYERTDETEVTIECNPENLTKEYIEGLKSIGINRPSLGIQTTLPDQLRRLERLSTSKNILNSIEWVSKKFKNFTLDFMLGIPDQTLESLDADIRFVKSIQPPHISAYLLTLDDDHKLKTNPAIRDKIANSDLAAAMYEKICVEFSATGYSHYEVSNFAKPGFESRHNSNYWNAESDYFGFGPGAHGYVKMPNGNRVRYETHRDLKTWASDPTGIFSFEVLSVEAKMLERVYLALRSKKPLDATEFSTQKVKSLQAEAFIQNDAEQILLTEKGWLSIESVAAQLLF